MHENMKRSIMGAGMALMLCVALVPGFAGDDRLSKPEGATGAVDPRLPGYYGPPPIQDLTPTVRDAAVGPNLLVNDRQLCPNGRGLQQNETSIVVSGDVVIAAFNDARGARSACPDLHAAIGWGYSLDGGATFTDGGGLPRSAEFNSGDPWLGVSPDGQTFYLSGIWNNLSGFGFYRGAVTNGAITWGDPVVVNFGPGTYDKEAFVVDHNTGAIYLTYTWFNPRSILLTRSTDGGDTWQPPVTVARGDTQGSFPTIDNRGNLYIAYNLGYPSPIQQTAVARSTDGGQTFDTLVRYSFLTLTMFFIDRAPSFPQIAVDNSGGKRDGWVYLVWHGLRSPDNYLRPYMSHSEDGGATWSEPTPINTDTETVPHWYPSVSVDDNGNVNVIFYDRRLNPGTGRTDLFLAQAGDGGQTFTNTRVTDVSGNWQGVRHDSGFIYHGDYIRAVSRGTVVYAAWTDPRNGDPDIYFARIDAAALAARRRE